MKSSSIGDNSRRSLLCFRFFAAVVLFLIVIHAVIHIEFVGFCIAYTQWGLILTTLLFFSLTLSTAFKFTNPTLLRFNKIAFETMWCSEIVITLFFGVSLLYVH